VTLGELEQLDKTLIWRVRQNCDTKAQGHGVHGKR
jgi:hypothetical protein